MSGAQVFLLLLQDPEVETEIENFLHRCKPGDLVHVHDSFLVQQTVSRFDASFLMHSRCCPDSPELYSRVLQTISWSSHLELTLLRSMVEQNRKGNWCLWSFALLWSNVKTR